MTDFPSNIGVMQTRRRHYCHQSYMLFCYEYHDKMLFAHYGNIVMDGAACKVYNDMNGTSCIQQNYVTRVVAFITIL